MSKLIGLTLNKGFGILKAQTVEFVEANGLIEVKAPVGSGKTTLKEASEMAISAGNKQIAPFDADKYKDIDVEMALTYGENPIYLRTYVTKGGTLTSAAYLKDEAGKKVQDPVIGGKKLTPSVLRDVLRTELTFGIDNFLSENPRTHMEFMMKIYSHKLKKLGVVFDKKSPAYENSILWRLDQGKADRAEKHIKRRGVNAFREALDAEGWDEQNVPALINIQALETKLEELQKTNQQAQTDGVRTFYADKEKQVAALQTQIDAITNKASGYAMKLQAYNDNIELNLGNDITTHNEASYAVEGELVVIRTAINTLEKHGAPETERLNSWYKGLSQPKPVRSYVDELKIAKRVPFTADGKLAAAAFDLTWTGDVEIALEKIQTLRNELKPIIAEKALLTAKQAPTLQAVTAGESEIVTQMAGAKESNKIAERWAAFYDWQAADDAVKAIWKEYCALFAGIDLGVNGLQITIVGDEEESEIRTVYNGVHNPEFFGNTTLEARLLTQYSSTQRPVIAILMQVYLLQEKMKLNEDGLRLMWIECPIDKKTRDLLISIQKEYDLTIIAGITGDFTAEGLEQGQFLIENGELLTLKD